MALQPLFRLGNVPVATSGGVRSLLAFWIGGACATPFTPPVPPTPEPRPLIDGGGVGRPRRRPQYQNAFEAIRRQRLDELEELQRQLLAQVQEAPAPVKSTIQQSLADITSEMQRIQDELDDEDDIEFLLLH